MGGSLVVDQCSFRRVGTVADPFANIRADVRAGLTSRPRSLPSKYFYDRRGSALFEEITLLPEYYQTRAEAEILELYAHEIVAESNPTQLVELGSGAAVKTRYLLNAIDLDGQLESFVPVDISEETLRDSAARLVGDYPSLQIEGLIGDFDHQLFDLPPAQSRLVVMLGGTIGNFDPVQRRRFLRSIGTQLDSDDRLMLGIDLVKDRARLEAAYNDATGVTEAFNKNILAVINSYVGSNFDCGRFEHRAFFDSDNSWIEMRLRASETHSVDLGWLDCRLDFQDGDEIRTEISYKYTLESIKDAFAEAGFEFLDWYRDRGNDFALALARPQSAT